MKPPTNLTELLDHLAAHPRFRTESNHPLVRQDECEFVDFNSGSLWFRSSDGKLRHFPIECGRVASETGLEFTATGFTVTKFGVTITCTYQEGTP